ncbi:hypothetical protein Pla52o_34550 [Novipirellula galeiformis]|uniref:Uncharacterized protein n=1 Tax=Novipirellula galeiformis TaxID=2528004 RepID=A0A5C6CI23_9BACT|nr:hypothetical protein [Novipirellula galeiformis]TWU22399.1 hypothetical protein Pla52o_34550 [Novipirellula galeiformis]
MKKWFGLLSLCLLGLGLLASGCTPSEVASGPDAGDASSSAVSSQFVVDSEPEGAIPVGEARQSIQDEEAVTLVGLIGGSSNPFVDGLAAFTIVDAKVPYCAPEEGCPTPWDYCCETDAVKDNIATVKLVDATGKPVANDARELLNVKELSTVVVEGTAKRDEQGNLSVNASKVYVRPE